jgi:predicted DNA-binding protein
MLASLLPKANITATKCEKLNNNSGTQVRGSMTVVREIVLKALKTGYLSVEAEEKLRQQFTKQHSLADIDALARLQWAAMNGLLKQESRQTEAKLDMSLTA